jgi:peptidoglycan-associated lipoprotein
MKSIKLFLTVLGCALTITAVGCKKKTPGVTPLPNGSAMSKNGGGNSNGRGPLDSQPPLTSDPNDVASKNASGISLTDSSKFDNYIPHPDILQAQTIHFDFDKSAVKTSDEPKLEEVANYMKSNPSHALRVEGNCDERGTEEYNRSLGERRALAAREYLSRLGIDPGRVVTISYGQDRPADTGHAESAWSKNRRDDFVVLTPPK